MPDFAMTIYEGPRRWIKHGRSSGKSWDYLMTMGAGDNAGLEDRLAFQADINYWPELSADEWRDLVSLQKTAEENSKKNEFRMGMAQIHDEGEENAVSIPEDEYSSWQLYKNKLLRDGFKEETVEQIEKSTIRTLKRLSSDTRKTGPVKGLVIGNVQSGKTANMAALMAMAADWGWNMFIVLSGTIENLRIQTQNRLFNDLNQQGTLFWRSLEHLSKSVDLSQRAQNLHFDSASKERYFTVCLKNSSRLEKLIQWAQVSPHKQEQMKVLVIDDEADQASINTASQDTEERKKINMLICALVNGKNEMGKESNSNFLAMNYIGYTATPYANILNEADEESLYPRSFISTLAVSKEYFGPQQIFGYQSDSPDTYFEGLDIVRTISGDELDKVKEVHEGMSCSIPESLADAVCWFLCGVSCMRIWGYKKPVSMLVHTSQKTDHHEQIAGVINNWLVSTPEKDILSRTKEIWLRETTAFSLETFHEEYPNYDRPKELINTYPNFDEIERQIKIILGDGISHITLGDDGDLSYHKGIHLCIDNCKKTGITSDGMHVRLAYPEAHRMPAPAPAFIVVGGATLSRGLTIEGLVSTYFLRSVGQADTLMQMGRWFGYRKNYELLPRLWITEKTEAQFRFLSALDQELRDEIQYMDINGRSPSEYGPKVKNSPKLSFIRLTAKNKMQSATASEMDYSGASNQTYLFDDNAEVLDANIRETERFIKSLGPSWKGRDPLGLRTYDAVWKDVSVEKISGFIRNFRFQERLKVFNDVEPLLKWVEKMTAEGKIGTWNVVVAGKQDSENGVWVLPDGTKINKVRRTRRAPKNEFEDKIIDIGVLRRPKDMLADIDVDTITDEEIRGEIISYIESGETKGAMAYRDKSGMDTTPQLLIYRVDKGSKVTARKSKDRTQRPRMDLMAARDLIGICLYIPGGRKGTSYASSVSINMPSVNLFDGTADMEGTNED